MEMSPRITGRTRLAGIIGWPVAQSLSPVMHNAAYRAVDFDCVYVPLPVADETDLIRVVGAIRVLPFVGFNVTMPYKQVMLDLCDEVAMLAQMAGAVNTVHCVDGRLIGYNTDGRGLVDALRAEVGFEPAGSTVALVGSGGAAGAALVSLVLGKASLVTIVNRTLENAEALAERIRPHARGTTIEVVALDEGADEVVRGADLVVNATPLGMQPGEESPGSGRMDAQQPDRRRHDLPCRADAARRCSALGRRHRGRRSRDARRARGDCHGDLVR
jgi:shikimate dehydrogenase